jgi:ribosome-associated toxin RatA of RatAB toxin-antitoxin module
VGQGASAGRLPKMERMSGDAGASPSAAFHSMKTVNKSVLIWYSAEEMFRLVTDVDAYPEFLPWCDRASILSQDDDTVTAQVGIAFSGIHQSFTTRNTQIAGREVHMALVDGPFSELDGHWVFQPVEAAGSGTGQGPNKSGLQNQEPSGAGVETPAVDAPRACRIQFTLNYGFSNFALSALVGPVFDRIAGSFVDAFVKRAEEVYGNS